ncbi:translation protein [Aspergillus crustosus]
MPPRLSKVFTQLPSSTYVLASSLITQNVFSIRAFGIRSLNPPKPSRYDNGPGLPVLKSTPAAALERKANTLPLRTGAITIKKGMTAIFDQETGARIPCTILQLDRVQVVAHKTKDIHGYYAVQIGAGWKHHTNVGKSLLGHYAGQGVSPKRHVYEFRVKDESGLLPIGQLLNADWFLEGQYVDTRSNTKGKGFAGVMKRHGFHGQDRSHGVSLTHRSLGSAGPSQGGGSRVYPGKKMAGNMGNEQNTVQNLRILKVDAENGLVLINGAVSGPKGCVVRIQDAIKKPWPTIKRQVAEPAANDIN